MRYEHLGLSFGDVGFAGEPSFRHSHGLRSSTGSSTATTTFATKHEADWEGVTVFFHNGVPIGVSYSQHQGRKWTPWAPTSASANTPSVYVARGSHANYPVPGRYAIHVCWTLHGRYCTPTRNLDDATGTGAALTPSGYDLHEARRHRLHRQLGIRQLHSRHRSDERPEQRPEAPLRVQRSLCRDATVRSTVSTG